MSRDDIAITTASLSDVPQLCELLAVLFTQEVEFTASFDNQRRGLTQILSQPESGAILVARHQQGIVGMVNLLYTVSTALGERVAILEDMIIAPEERGFGIGSMLLTHTINHARRVGCKRITLLTDIENKPAHHFYQRHGFVASLMTPLRLSLID